MTVRSITSPTLDTALRFVVLNFKDIELVLSQAEVAALEPALDVRPPAEDAKQHCAGELALKDGACPVYAFDTDLRCLPSIPNAHRVCAILHTPADRQPPFALSCHEVQLVARSALAFHAIPRPFANARSPVQSLATHDGRLLLATNAMSLRAYIARPAPADVIPFDTRIRSIRI